MATMLCEYCDKEGCSLMTQNTVTKEECFYCSFECCAKGMASDKIDKGIDLTNKKIKQFSDLRDEIRKLKFSPEWKGILPFVYGWLMFYLAVKRRDTRSRLEKLFQLAIKKNQEVFSEMDGNQIFKDSFPPLFHIISANLVKDKLDDLAVLIDLFATTDSESETV
jgi:hypothetical protein